MRRLISSSLRRQLSLLEKLINTKEWFTLSELADELNCSKRTLSDDIQELSSYDLGCEIKSSTQGIRIQGAMDRSPREILAILMREAPIFKLLEYLFFKQEKSLEYLSDFLYLSPTTTLRLVKKLSNYLKKEHAIYLDSKNIMLTGPEENIRLIYIQYFYEAYQELEWPFSEYIEEKYFVDFLKEAVKTFDIRLDFSRNRQVKIQMFVNLQRVRDGYFLEYDSTLPKLLEWKDLSMPIRALVPLQKRYASNIEPLTLVEQLLPGYLQQGFIFNESYFEWASSHSPMIKQSFDLLYDLLDTHEKQFHFTISNKKEVAIEMHNMSFLSRFEPGVFPLMQTYRQDFVKKANDEYPTLIEGFKYDIVKYLEQVGLEATEDLINYLIFSLITTWRSILKDLNINIPKANMVVISQIDWFHSLFLKECIDARVGKILNIEVYSEPEITKDKLETLDIDYIVSNFTLPKIPGVKHFYINDYPTWQEMVDISREIIGDYYYRLNNVLIKET